MFRMSFWRKSKKSVGAKKKLKPEDSVGAGGRIKSVIGFRDASEFHKYFEKYLLKLPDVVEFGGNRTLFFPSRDGKDPMDIEDIIVGCGCTADVKWDEDGVTAVFTNTESLKDGVREKDVEKILFVKFADGRSKIWSKKLNRMVWPPDKASCQLKFTATVRCG